MSIGGLPINGSTLMSHSVLPKAAVSALLAVGLGACGLKPPMTRTQPTRFLASTGVDFSEKSKRLPFEHSWRDPSAEWSAYKHIVVRPVTTAYLNGDRWEESQSTLIPNKRSYLKQCAALARHWDKSLAKQFSSPLCMFYKTTDTTKPGTLILEIALTEVRFDRSVRPTGTSVASSGLSTSLPVCGFEARTRDAATGKIIATSADRRAPTPQLRSRADEPFTAPNRSICDEWSAQMMQRSNVEIFPKVGRNWFDVF